MRISAYMLITLASLVGSVALGKPDPDYRARCQTFLNEAMAPLHRDPMTRLVNQRQHGNSAISDEKSALVHVEVAQKVQAVCEAVDLAALTSRPCWYVLGRPAHDPAEWCGAAAEAPALVRQAVLNHARRVVNVTGSSSIQTPAAFQERDGFLSFEGPVAFEDRLTFGGAKPSGSLKTVSANVEALLKSVGWEDSSVLWGEQKERLDELRKAVESSAHSWKSPAPARNPEGRYGGRLAKVQIKKWHPRARIHSAYLSRPSWKIHKNPLGVIQRRTLPGYVLFKRPKDPYCQLRPFTLTEAYSGGGKYQKAATVSIGYVRFQACS